MKLYAIKDAGTGVNQVLMTSGDYNAQRIMSEFVNGQHPLMSKYPKDFSLWSIGEIDQDTGKVSPTEPSLVAEAINMVKKTGQEEQKQA